jgi:hypothetical protein
MPPLLWVVVLLFVVAFVLGGWREVNRRRNRALEAMEAKRVDRREQMPPTHFNCRCEVREVKTPPSMRCSLDIALPSIELPLPRMPALPSLPKLPSIGSPMTDAEIAAIMEYLVVGRPDMEYLGDIEAPSGVEPQELWTALGNQGGRPSVLVARATLDLNAASRHDTGLVFHLYTPEEDQHGRPGP